MQEIEKLKEFLESPRFNQWLEGDELHVYVRKGHHLSPNQEIVKTLDIANIFSLHPGKGIFTHFLEEAEQISPFTIYIENVSEPRFREFFLKRGYIQTKNTIENCFFAPTKIRTAK